MKKIFFFILLIFIISKSFSQSVYKSTGSISWTGTTSMSYIASDDIKNDWTKNKVQGNNGAVTLTSTPSLEDGLYDGQIVIIIGMSDGNTLTLQDETSLGNSGLQLAGSANITLGKFDIIILIYDSTLDKWIELSRSNN